jgi:predicted nuclease with TOPRIM domain
LEALAVEIKILSTNLIILLTTLFYPLRVNHVSLKGKLFHATKENIELQQEVVYLTARLEKTVLSEKMIEDDLSRVKESARKSTYKLGIEFERCEDKGEKSAP